MGYTLGNALGIIDGEYVGLHVGLVGSNEYDGEAVVGTTDGGDDTVGEIDGKCDGENVGC